MPAFVLRLLRLDDATPAERAATVWTAVAFFCVLFAYYLLRPLRENVSYAFGTSQLLWLFALTFVLITLINQPYVALVRRLPSHRFLPYGLHAFAASFVVLALAFAGGDNRLGALSWGTWQGRGLALFYSWVTAFSVCGVTLVWVHAVEWFTTAQGKRLFGLVSVGGTLGAVAGSWVSLRLAHWSYSVLLGMAAAGVELAVLCWWLSLRACRRMERTVRPHALAHGPSYFAGLARVVRDPYLRAMAAFVLLAAVTATTFYYQRNQIVSAQLVDDEARRTLEASINLWQSGLCLGVQLFFTSRALLVFGVAVVLCVMPAISLAGLVMMSVWPLVAVAAVVEVVRRMLQFAFDKPAREVVYTPLDIEAKYVSKAVIDTTALRLGDLLGAVANDLLRRANAGNTLLLLCSAPLLLVWVTIGAWLGRACQRREQGQRPAP
ncbi:MAG: Npt1/Npt2 family nucleotide transporter [Planctomycetota bacterium]